MVVAEDNIEPPMQRVLNLPMGADDGGELGGAQSRSGIEQVEGPPLDPVLTAQFGGHDVHQGPGSGGAPGIAAETDHTKKTYIKPAMFCSGTKSR